MPSPLSVWVVEDDPILGETLSELLTDAGYHCRWINDGAHIYVCGDANRMAKDVEQTLLEVIAEYGAMDAEAADEFLSELRVERRYQRDVY